MILVTGASGHLGQWVVAELCARGHDVLCASRQPKSEPSITGLRWSRPVRAVPCDLGSADGLTALAAELPSVRAVVHLAAFIPEDTAANTDEDADTTLRVNAAGTAALLAALTAAPQLEAFVHASTFEVYGPVTGSPIEEASPTEPVNHYGASKLAGEKYVRLFGEDRKVPCSSLRLPAIYGPGDTLRRAIGNFVRAAAAGRPLEIQGDGSDLRELVFAADAARAVVSCLERRSEGAFNIGSGHGISIREMAEAVQRASGTSPPIVTRERVKPRVDYVLSIERATRLLGWSPATSLEDGARSQLDWVRSLAAARSPRA